MHSNYPNKMVTTDAGRECPDCGGTGHPERPTTSATRSCPRCRGLGRVARVSSMPDADGPTPKQPADDDPRACCKADGRVTCCTIIIKPSDLVVSQIAT